MANVRIGSIKLYTEIPVMLLFYSFMLCEPINTNFIIYRTCYITLGFNESDCAKLGGVNVSNDTAALEKIVEPHANVILMTSSLATQILPALVCLFIGPWSDRNGRKPVMIFTLLGFTIGGAIQIIVSTVSTLSPWFLLMSAVPVVLCGGFPPFIMVVLCHLTDVTNVENRGLRIGILEAMIALGMLVGTLSSSFLFSAVGYTAVYGISTCCMFLAWLYTLFLTEESVIASENQDDISVFTLTNVREMLRATFKEREKYQRAVLLITVLVTVIYLLASTADSSVIFLYLRENFNWSLEQYTLYKSATASAWIVGTFIGICVLHKLCRITERILLLIAFVVFFASVMIQGFATDNLHMYIAGGIRCIGGVISPMCRSLISKIVSPDEIGKVFSVAVTLESLSVMIGSPIYTLIYNYTISSAPGMFNFVTAGLFGLEIILILVIIGIQSLRGNQYQILEDVGNED